MLLVIAAKKIIFLPAVVVLRPVEVRLQVGIFTDVFGSNGQQCLHIIVSHGDVVGNDCSKAA